MGLGAGPEVQPLTVTVSPSLVQLGVTERAVVTVRGPPELTTLHLNTNHGSIGAVRVSAPGVFEADYRPPRETYPRIAIIAAWGVVGDQVLHGLLALPLWGQGTATVTAPAGTEVLLRIGTQDFGPVRVDERGRGEVPVRVPPGATHAMHGNRAIDLGLPVVSLVHVLAVPAEVRADVEQVVTLRVYTVSLAGTLETATVKLSVPVGKVGPLTWLRPGVAEASWRLPAQAPTALEVTAWTPGAKGAPAGAALRVTPGPAVSLALTGGDCVAGQGRPVELRLTMRDLNGRPAEDVVSWSSDFGKVTDVVAGAPGEVVARLELPNHFEGRHAATVTARTAGAVTTLSVPLVPGAPSEVRLSADATVRARESTLVRGTVVDAFGNVVPAPPSATAGAGEVTVLSSNDDGFVLRFTAPPTHIEQTAELEVGLAGVTGRRHITVQPRASRLTASLRGGYATNFAAVSSPAAALELGGWAELGGRHLGLLLEGGLIASWGSSRLESQSIHSHRSFFVPLTLSVATTLALSRQAWLRPAAGGGLTAIVHTLQLSDGPALEERALAATALVSLQAGLRLGPGGPFVELRGLLVADPGLNTLQGPLISLMLSAGYTFELL